AINCSVLPICAATTLSTVSSGLDMRSFALTRGPLAGTGNVGREFSRRQRPGLWRGRKETTQLRSQARLAVCIAARVLDPQRQPERLRCRLVGADETLRIEARALGLVTREVKLA